MPTNSLPGSPPVRVLLIDDDRDDYVLTRDLLADVRGDRYRLDWAPDYETGLAAVLAGEHDVCLLDYRLGPKTGLDLLAEVRAAGSTAAIILLTGQSASEIDLAAAAAGADDYLEKGKLDATLLERAVRYALLRKRYEADLAEQVRNRTAELARANAALVEGDRRKDEFLATLAHELRNPLAPIRNALEILRLGGSNPAAGDQARQIMDRQIRQMVRLIDDLLDVSRITRGKLRLTTERLSVAEPIEVAVEATAPALNKAGLRLAVELPSDPVWVTGDRVRLAQVFANLLNNAAKYTERGGDVVLTAAQDGAHAVVRVRDTGVGIPPDALPHVFELFTQVDRNLNRTDGGLGIGLALAKRLVELQRGTIDAASDGVGSGASFVVRLPLAAKEHPGDRPPDEEDDPSA